MSREHETAAFVRALGYRDPESALTALRARTRRRGADRAAHLQLGRIYAGLGRDRDAATEFRRGTVWVAEDSERFRLLLIPGSTAHQEREMIRLRKEAGLRKIESVFRIPYANRGRILCHYYESIVHKAVITGDPMPAHAFPGARRIHAVWGADLRVDGPHEDAHVVLHELGEPPRLLQEGAAEYVSRGAESHSLWRQAARWVHDTGIAPLADDAVFEAADGWFSYPASASFVGFLIEEYGVDRFKRLYRTAAGDPERAACETYGKTLVFLEREWRDFLDGRAAAPGSPARIHSGLKPPERPWDSAA